MLTYDSVTHTLAIDLAATGLTPGPHTVHVHAGSCVNQGPPMYMPPADVVADKHGDITER